MVRDPGAEADDPAGDEDRREDEDVGDVLAALERVVVDQEVAFLERLDRMAPQAGAQRLADRAELHGDQLGLGHGVAVAVHQAGRAVARLAQDGRIGGADQLHAHLAGAGDQRLADDGIVEGTELGHAVLRSVRFSIAIGGRPSLLTLGLERGIGHQLLDRGHQAVIRCRRPGAGIERAQEEPVHELPPCRALVMGPVCVERQEPARAQQDAK